MRAYLNKDFQFMQSEGIDCVILIMLAICVPVISMRGYDGLEFWQILTAFTGILATVHTVSSEKEENGLSFLFTLPVSRKEYVIEKYVFSALFTLKTAALAEGGVIISMWLLKKEWTDIAASLYTGVVSVLLAFIFMSVVLPFVFNEIRSMISVLFILVFCFGTLIFLIMLPERAVELLNAAEAALHIQKVSTLGTLAAAGVISIAVSCAVSIGIMKKREF